ncbi:uncharacterized protein LOC103786919 [Pan paniscus]|uniref:uncharacterized protein LOC103786919 n=1 Tax=Pan paniscus TaxID=9597 RepID=UPI00243685D3|nr:uncharacterized protein LOC103786919 [Pan paniscus]
MHTCSGTAGVRNPHFYTRAPGNRAHRGTRTPTGHTQSRTRPTSAHTRTPCTRDGRTHSHPYTCAKAHTPALLLPRSRAKQPQLPSGTRHAGVVPGTSPSVTVASASSRAFCTSSRRDFRLRHKNCPGRKSCSSVTKRSCTLYCRRAGTRAGAGVAAMVQAPLLLSPSSASPALLWAPRNCWGKGEAFGSAHHLPQLPLQVQSSTSETPGDFCWHLLPSASPPSSPWRARWKAATPHPPHRSAPYTRRWAQPPSGAAAPNTQVWRAREAPESGRGLEAKG